MDWVVAFLVGDYLLQNDWMVKGKKKSSWICTVHVFFFMLPFLFLSLSWLQLSLIAIQHWIQDRTNIIDWFLNFLRCLKFEICLKISKAFFWLRLNSPNNER